MTLQHQPARFGSGWGPLAHHDGSGLYVSNPYPALGDRVGVRVRVRDSLGVQAAHVRSTRDGDQTFTPCRKVSSVRGESWWQADLVMANSQLNYRFLLSTPDGAVWLNGAGLHVREVSDVADFRLATDPPPPAWVGGAVFYEVFIDRFARGTGCHTSDVPVPEWATSAAWEDPVVHGHPDAVRQLYRGDLWGVVEHLDHLHDLGVTVVYLTPFFPARSNHRYDAISFDRVDPLLGGDDALAHLVSAARAYGIRVIGDLTLNHTGDGHDWFVRACGDPDSVEAGFYLFREHPAAYESFADVPSLPKLDHRSAELRRRLFGGLESTAARYLREPGLAGWRIDVAQSAGHAGGSNRTLDTARATRATMQEAAPGAYLVAEHQFDASAALAGDGWHGAMAYAAFTRPVWSWLADEGIDVHWGVPTNHRRYTGSDLAATIEEFTALIPWGSRIHSLNLLDSHDTPRLRTVVGPQRFAVAVGLLLSFPGVPMIFSGDEIGTDGIDLEQARQPFRWDPDTWDADVLQLHRRLIALRREHPALSGGGFRWLHLEADVVVFERATATETLIVQASRAPHPPVHCPSGALDLLGNHDLPETGGDLPTDGPAVGMWLLPTRVIADTANLHDGQEW